jgi:hypothetical protein
MPSELYVHVPWLLLSSVYDHWALQSKQEEHLRYEYDVYFTS